MVSRKTTAWGAVGQKDEQKVNFKCCPPRPPVSTTAGTAGGRTQAQLLSAAVLLDAD